MCITKWEKNKATKLLAVQLYRQILVFFCKYFVLFTRRKLNEFYLIHEVIIHPQMSKLASGAITGPKIIPGELNMALIKLTT